ncbi:hypothetical protein [Tychonema bourrellyi]|uniref:hypothetical protein n=1 Tax=Tychonema bourrellyi TaxID=54313 RepID=UPI0015D47459|nr:hypothetical protein [Tychonema bourrellyi]
MPVPQYNLLFVEQARKPVFMNGQDAHPTIQFTLCGTGQKACFYGRARCPSHNTIYSL